MIYELIETPMGEQQVKRTNEDGSESWIPIDESNADYIAYLASLEAPAKAAKGK